MDSSINHHSLLFLILIFILLFIHNYSLFSFSCCCCCFFSISIHQQQKSNLSAISYSMNRHEKLEWDMYKTLRDLPPRLNSISVIKNTWGYCEFLRWVNPLLLGREGIVWKEGKQKEKGKGREREREGKRDWGKQIDRESE